MRMRATRPAPVCRVISPAVTADPVRMNWPGSPRIDRPTDVVPDRGNGLPFIDQPRRFSGENQCRLDIGRPPGLLVHIEHDGAACKHRGCCGFPAGFRTLEDNGSGRGQPEPDFRLDDTLPVR